jgi:hypothetical protein
MAENKPGVDPLVAVSLDVKGQKKPRPRKLTLTRALREATKAGVSVASATIEDGKVLLTFGEAVKTSGSDELDGWMAKHANSAKGH